MQRQLEAPLTDIQTVEGLRVQADLPRAATIEEVRDRFPAMRVDAKPLGATATCAAAISAAMAAISSRPPFLSEKAVQRHLSFLEHLSRIRYEDIPRGWERQGLLANRPLADLEFALEAWVAFFRYRRDEAHVLGASFALQTAMSLMDLVFGNYMYGRRTRVWQLIGLADGEDDLRGSNDRLDTPLLKREITQHLRGTSVLGQVPMSGRLVSTRSPSVAVLGPGTMFVARIQRCHLSTGFYDNHLFRCDDVGLPDCDLDDRFEFYGGLVPVFPSSVDVASGTVQLHPIEGLLSAFDVDRGYLPSGDVPGDWIVAAVEEAFREPVGRLVPMPWRPLEQFKGQ